MKNRIGVLAATALVGSALAAQDRIAAGETDRRPNFLVIVADDVALSDVDALTRADRAEVLRLHTIEWLASEGVVFRRFHAMPICAPTRYGLLFGGYRGGVNGVTCGKPGPQTPAAGQPSLAEVLQDAGYRTAAFGKWHLGAHPDPSQPWEAAPAARGFGSWRAWNASNLSACGSSGYFDWIRVDDGTSVRTTEYHTRAVTDAVLEWWYSVDGPRFAYVAYQAPHQPLHLPPGLPAEYPRPTTPREKYEAMLKSLDLAVKDLVDGILHRPDRRRSSGLGNTYVIFLGDNGTPPAAVSTRQNKRRVKKTTFADGVNVPFVVVGPGVRRGMVTQALGHVVDVFRTVAELAGVHPPDGAARDSVSLVPCLTDSDARPRLELICDVDLRADPAERWDRCVVADVEGRLWKLRRFTDFLRLNNNKEQLFDLGSDRGERQALNPGGPLYPTSVANRLKSILTEYENRGR